MDKTVEDDLNPLNFGRCTSWKTDRNHDSWLISWKRQCAGEEHTKDDDESTNQQDSNNRNNRK